MLQCYLSGNTFGDIVVEVKWHYNNVTMSVMASQITDVPIVCSTICSGADPRKPQSSAWLAFVRGIHRWPTIRYTACSRKQQEEHQNSALLVLSEGNPPVTGWLTHWGRVAHLCVGKINIIGSDNGLSPRRRQAIIWTIAGILLIGPLGTNFSEILIGIQTFSFTKMHLKMSSAKWRPFVSASMC